MKLKNILWGLVFIAGAGVIILSFLGLLGGINWWSVAISVPVAAWLIYSIVHLEWAGFFLSAGLLVWIYRSGIESWLGMEQPISFWPVACVALLLAIGFSIIFPQKKWKKDWQGKWESKYCTGNTSETVTGEKLYFKERFTGTSKYISSDNLSYVQIINSFGGMEVYFDHCTLAPEGATMEIHNKFGGMELYIPRGWNIINRVSNSFSGVDCPKTQFTEGAPTLTISGDSTFGGVDVKLV